LEQAKKATFLNYERLYSALFRPSRGHLPYAVANVIGDKQCACSVNGHANRTAQRIIWRNGFSHPIRPWRLHSRIGMLTVIAVRPSLEGAVFYRGHIVGHQVTADLIAFVDGSPEFTALRLSGKAIGVAQSRGEDARTACCGLNFLLNRKSAATV
jgi:hypothetical protein